MKAGDKQPLLPIRYCHIHRGQECPIRHSYSIYVLIMIICKLHRHGKGICSSSNDCNAEQGGACVNGRCVCPSNFTGPRCLAHNGFETTALGVDINDDYEWSKHAFSLFIPTELKLLAVAALVGLVSVVVYKYRHNRSQQGRWRYTPVPT